MLTVKKTAHAFGWNFLNRILGFFFDLILSIVLARGLGSYEFGLYSELFNIIFLFSLFCSMGTDTAANVLIPKYRDNKARVARIVQQSFFLVSVTSLLAIMALILFRGAISALIHSPDLRELLFIGAFYVLAFNFLTLIQSILIALYRTKQLFIYNTILKLSFVIVAFLAFFLHRQLIFIIVLFTVLTLLICLMWLYNLRDIIALKAEKQSKNGFYQFGFTAWLVKVLNYLLGRNFDIFLMGVYKVAKSEIAYYSIAFTLTMALSYVFTSGFSGVALSVFSDRAKDDNKKGIAKGWLVILKIMLVFCVPIFLFSIFSSKDIICLLYSEEYLPSAGMLSLFASFYFISMFWGSGTNSAILFAMQKQNLVLKLRFFLGSLNVILDFILVPAYGAIGAIIATGVSIVGIIIAEYFAIKNLLEFKYPVKFTIKVTVSAIGALSPIIILSYFNIYSLFQSGLLFCIVFILFLYIVKPFEENDIDLLGEISPKLPRFIILFAKSN